VTTNPRYRNVTDVTLRVTTFRSITARCYAERSKNTNDQLFTPKEELKKLH